MTVMIKINEKVYIIDDTIIKLVITLIVATLILSFYIGYISGNNTMKDKLIAASDNLKSLLCSNSSIYFGNYIENKDWKVNYYDTS